MPANPTLAGILQRYRDGAISLDDAACEIEGFRIERVGEFANLDLGRSVRCGMPEVVLAEGKDADQLTEIALAHAENAGRCIITRITPEQAAKVTERAAGRGMTVDHRELGRVLVVSDGRPAGKNGGIVAVITAGTSDIPVAEEAKVIAEEMGSMVFTAYDVGAAGIHRLFPALKPLLGAHAFIVCAGREGTLPAVVAGLVDRPVIGVPVSTGYGYMGGGRAALASMLQSCSVVAVVNIDAGFTAGAFAARVAALGAEERKGS
ncbi:MAG TPA: nickel pincer cofactor biosynthesis protein LarB [Methanoregulaceae archaeon]|nr:nickel pincer cofactor biosynthesis protein LarB [Methanoregulaceae archaeon]